jgi:hypothetical protein
MINEDSNTIDVRGPPLRSTGRNPMSDPVLPLHPDGLRRTRNLPKSKQITVSTEQKSNSSVVIPLTSVSSGILLDNAPALFSHNGGQPNLVPVIPSLPQNPSSISLPPKYWYEHSPRQWPMETVQSYIQDLHIVQVPRFEDVKIPLCPFILSHLQPSDHILPHLPLFLPSCPGYLIFLLYALKEIPPSPIPTNQPQTHLVVFSVIFPEHRCPSIIGSKVDQGFIERIRYNIREERVRTNQFIRGVFSTFSPQSPVYQKR